MKSSSLILLSKIQLERDSASAHASTLDESEIDLGECMKCKRYFHINGLLNADELRTKKQKLVLRKRKCSSKLPSIKFEKPCISDHLEDTKGNDNKYDKDPLSYFIGKKRIDVPKCSWDSQQPNFFCQPANKETQLFALLVNYNCNKLLTSPKETTSKELLSPDLNGSRGL